MLKMAAAIRSLSKKKTLLTLSLLMSLSSVSHGNGVSCLELVDRNNPKIALLKQPLPADVQARLNELVAKDPDLALFLENADFIRLLQAMGEGRSLEEMRPLINNLWKDEALSQHALGAKTGALLIGPQANNNSKLVEIIKQAEIEKMGQAGLSRTEKAKQLFGRIKDQIGGMRKSLQKSKEIVQTEMSVPALDGNLFDFYGYLNLGLRASQLREWQAPPGSFAAVKLSDIKDMDPMTFVRVLMLASQIEEPINGYSDESGKIFSLFPQAARFMGKTEEQAAYHRKQRGKLHCTNSWCEEENRHEGMLENLARRLLGLVLPNNRPFDADRTLSPFVPADVQFHVMARANNELAASSTYIALGGHAEGNTAIYLGNIRGDELKHSTIFTGLYEYLFGETYWKRFGGVVKKTLIELADKNANSDYASVFKNEPLTLIEFLYVNFQYEKQVKKYLGLLPLKTLRKFFETDINLEPLKEEPMDPAKKQRVDQMSVLEKARREALANWPQKQRDAAYKLEYFESEYNEALSGLVRNKFKNFKGAEDHGTAADKAVVAQIAALTAADLQAAGFTTVTKATLELAKKSLNATLRDYQIMNNQKVRAMGLNVQFIDITKGFDVVKDEAFARQQKVDGVKYPQAVIENQTQVIGVKQETSSTWSVRLKKPEGFTFNAGEAVEITLQSPQGPQTRALSMTNSPNRNYIEFAVRASDSYFKEALMKLQLNDNVGLGKPKGALKFKADRPAVFIAGGIGITPFRSIIQNVAETGTTTPMTLLYANRTAQDIPFKAELDQLANQTKTPVKVNYLVAEASADWQGTVGRIDAQYLAGVVKQTPADAVYYIVAPLPMVQGVRSALASLGVPSTQIVVESFPGYR